jgi:kinesin family member C2/C3
VFAYGQTGSGKTHTMEGPPEDPGINFRAMKELFRVMVNERRASHKHEINASIVEIYNE